MGVVVMMVVMVMGMPRPLTRTTTPPREAVERAERAAAKRFKGPGSH